VTSHGCCINDITERHCDVKHKKFTPKLRYMYSENLANRSPGTTTNIVFQRSEQTL